jgi:alkaline phosphatase D
VELFFLDTRQYRDASYQDDSPAQPKTMLGKEQRAWFKRALKSSDATWKIVVSSVPLSLPTGNPVQGNAGGRDGWANYDGTTGYEYELIGLLEFARSEGIKNLLFITTDVHFAAAFRYRPSAVAPDYMVHELVSGPLNAGLGFETAYDTTLGTERLFFHALKERRALTWEQAARYRTFGTVAVTAHGVLEAGIENELGERLYSLRLAPQ